MEKWRNVWRRGIAPQLPLAGLRALLTALVEDDPRLVQALTCVPTPLSINADRPIERACAVCFAGWNNGIGNVGDLTEFFDETCSTADSQFDEPAKCRYFLNWFDDTPREIMRRELIPEVELAIKAQEAKGGA